MGYLLLPLGIFAGWVAGAAMSRRMVRNEVQRLESLIEQPERPRRPWLKLRYQGA